MNQRHSRRDDLAEEDFAQRRRKMVDEQLRTREIVNPKVLAAMERVPRHEFVPTELQDSAYVDAALPIGRGQTISQPYIVALMTQLANPKATDRALDVGTGCGYQAAVLSELVRRVDSIEIVGPLAESAAARLERLGYAKVFVHEADGYHGWPQEAPFDIILLAAATPEVPPSLVDQLAVGGRMILPVEDGTTQLSLLRKLPDGRFDRREITPVRFVPMTGEVREGGRPGEHE
jgi:protein-L-isoaspartate(D-aspartate) O-methyltransferase